MGGGIEAEPGGQGAAVGQGCREAEAIAHIDIGKAGGGNGEAEARILAGCLIGDGHGGDRAVIGVGDGDGEILGGASP